MRRLCIVLVIGALVVVACRSRERHMQELLRRELEEENWRKPLTARESALLDGMGRHEFQALGAVNWRACRRGDPAALAALARNNQLWIQLYHTTQSKAGTFGLKIGEATDEGDPVTTYYLAQDGVVRRITDYSRDRFAGVGVKEECLEPFLTGYTGYELPCPCGSGKRWLDCDVGDCKIGRRPPTYVIVTRDFPSDKVLHWIPPPSATETSRTWTHASTACPGGD